MKKSTISAIAAVSVAGAAVIALGAVSSWFTNWNTKTWFGRGNNAVVSGAALQSDNFTLTPSESDGVMALSVKPRNAANSRENYPSYTLTASVNNNASNPKIDWSIETGADFSSGVENPVTVSPASDGALTATVTCKAAFNGILNVVATLRDVGSSATCSIVFEGIPTELNVSLSSLTQNGDYYEVAKTGDITAAINLDNIFHSVGGKYGQYTVTATAHGKVGFTGYTYNPMLGQLPAGGEVKNLSELSSDRLMQFSVSESTLTIKVNGALGAYAYTSTVSGGDTGLGTTTGTFRYSSEAEKCYYAVKVVDTVSGLYTTFNVTWGNALTTTVSLSQSVLTF